MDPIVTSSLIGAGTSLLGGMFGRSSARKQQSLALQQAAIDRRQQEKFARQGIQWRVEDARKAGLHPLYALGASTTAAAPVPFIPGQAPSGDFIREAGQQIGRAAQAKELREIANLNKEKVRAEIGEIRARQSAINQDVHERALNAQALMGKSASEVAGAKGEGRARQVDPQSDVAGQDVIVGPDGEVYKVPSLKFDDVFMPAHLSYQGERAYRYMKKKWKEWTE